jgi:release factor glutamine methyltransferase
VNRQEALTSARDALAAGNIEEPALEGEILLRHLLAIDRAGLYADLDRALNPDQEKCLHILLERRRHGEPSAYITGHREFYGLDFKVNTNVLIPRPETELLVEIAIKTAKDHNIEKIADIGTGCGAIAVSLAKYLPGATIYASDISPGALEIARLNCLNHGVADRVILLRGDLLEPLEKRVEMIVANLPYVRESDLPLNSYEPRVALDGGKDGLDQVKRLSWQAGGKLKKSGYLLLEMGQGQAETVVDTLCKVFPAGNIEAHKDLAGIERVVSLRLTSLRR